MPRVSLALTAFLLFAVHARSAVELVESSQPGFPLVRENSAAPIVLPPSAPELVRIAARDFADDIAAVSGVRPVIMDTPPSDPSAPRIELILSPASLSGRWEAFQVSATPRSLIVAGSDRRGLAYGVYELSRRIGVSPWHWWADVPVTHREALSLSLGSEPVAQPAVKYRGIFINDEDWGLVPWAAKTFEPEVGNLGPKTYSKLFELMLRLRANTLWPGMHPSTTPFHQVPGNAATADRYAIVLGSSHAEPMLRNNVGEWSAPKDTYNYLTHRDGVLAYWEQRIRERTSGESIFTLGMRGIHDSPIVGPKSQPERIATLEKIFAGQRDLLARHLGGGDPARVSQLFCPYKEVLDDYNAGLRVPDDVTLLWPDDNFGYIRRFGTPAEQSRSGGLGVYYHASYLGAPLAWLWIDTLPPALLWSEMMRAYEHGARTFWIVNVGDLKNTERSTEFFLDLAWRADRTNPDFPARFIAATAARDFGDEHASSIASILARHHSLAAARKPEHLQWNLPSTPYAPTTLTPTEIDQRLSSYATLVRDTDSVAAALPAAAQDAFFQLVAYPVYSAAAANERYFNAELARLFPTRADTLLAASRAASSRINELTARYNNDTAGGKWRGIVTVNGAPPGVWKKYQPDTPTPPPSESQPAAPSPPAPAPLSPAHRPPPDARPGDFVESGGVVSIHAGHFTARTDAPDAAGWRVIPGLGRTGSAVTVLPSNTVITPDNAPRLSYRFQVSTSSSRPQVLHVRLLPTHPLVSGKGLRFAFALNDAPPAQLAITSGFDPKSDAWKQRVLANAAETSLTLPARLAPGWHTLHLVAVDAGVVIDKIVIDLGGLLPSYDGPPETRLQ